MPATGEITTSLDTRDLVDSWDGVGALMVCRVELSSLTKIGDIVLVCHIVLRNALTVAVSLERVYLNVRVYTQTTILLTIWEVT